MKKQTSILHTLTIRSFQKNKGRNLAAVLAILLTTMMFTTLFTLAQSMEKHLAEMYLRQAGTKAHTSTKQITEEQIEKLASHPNIVSYGKTIVVGLAENLNLTGRQVEIRSASSQYAKDAFSYPTAGRMPQSKDEIALDTLILERLGIQPKLGQQVTLEWRKDLSSPKITSSTFTLCGFWEGNLSVYASMAWVSEDFALEACGGAAETDEGQICGLRMMSINFADSKNIEEKTSVVLSDSGLPGLKFQTNLTYTPELQHSILMESLPMYAGMFLVFLAGYLIIFNVFQISVASDIQFYGKLKTLGMTKKQIKRMLYSQGNLLSLTVIPIGLILGYLLGIVLLPVWIADEGTKAVVSANPVIFIGSALFTYITVMISCCLPAHLAGKVSPIEALRYTDTDTKGKQKKKKSKNGASLAGMAFANLGRNRKRTILVICSLTLGLVLMSFFYAQNASFDIEKYLINLTVADFQIDDATNKNPGGYDPESQTISNALLTEIEQAETLEKTGRLYSRQVEQTLSKQTCYNLNTFYTQERLDEFASYDPTFPSWKKTFDLAVGGAEIPLTVYGADGLILEAAVSNFYILDGAYDAQKFAAGQSVLAIGATASPQEGSSTYSVGETVTIENRKFTVMAVLLPLQPMVGGEHPAFDLPLILPADTFTQLWPDSHLRKYYFNVADEGIAAATSLLAEYQQTSEPGMNIISRQTMTKQYEAETRSAAVMGYTISIVTALVGILNFINSMVTAIISRKREFAMIQSIGMTKRQLRLMLTFEGLYYAAFTLAASYLLGAAAVGILVRSIASNEYSTFRFTLFPLVLCTPILLAFAVLIPYLCFKNLEKQSITERLRAAD